MHTSIEDTDRSNTLPDDKALTAAVAALEVRGFGTYTVDDLYAPRDHVVLIRRRSGSDSDLRPAARTLIRTPFILRRSSATRTDDVP
jgi:hypothetical protein